MKNNIWEKIKEKNIIIQEIEKKIWKFENSYTNLKEKEIKIPLICSICNINNKKLSFCIMCRNYNCIECNIKLKIGNICINCKIKNIEYNHCKLFIKEYKNLEFKKNYIMRNLKNNEIKLAILTFEIEKYEKIKINNLNKLQNEINKDSINIFNKQKDNKEFQKEILIEENHIDIFQGYKNSLNSGNLKIIQLNNKIKIKEKYIHNTKSNIIDLINKINDKIKIYNKIIFN